MDAGVPLGHGVARSRGDGDDTQTRSSELATVFRVLGVSLHSFFWFRRVLSASKRREHFTLFLSLCHVNVFKHCLDYD